ACENIPIPQGERRYSHCLYTDALMSQWISTQTVDAGCDTALNQREADDRPVGSSTRPSACTTMVLKLPQSVGESAFFGMTPSTGKAETDDALRRQLRILGGYFHE